MHNIEKLACLPEAFLENVISDRLGKSNNPRTHTQKELARIKPLLIECYVIYDKLFSKNKLELIQRKINITENDKESFAKLYSREFPSYNAILDLARSHNSGTCPYCSINLPTTIDHFVPKKEYPEYAAHCHNLIPVCADCNRRKKEQWRNNYQRLFLNPYLDKLEDYNFLGVRVTIEDNKPSILFYIENRGNISDSLFRIIETHYQILKIIETLNNACIETFYSIQSDLVTEVKMRNASLEKIMQLHVEQAMRKLQCFGKNHWKSLLEKAIFENKEFCTYIIDNT